jgi:hypothetical protein
MSEERENKVSREDVYSKAVRAGKRTYFFDVKATRTNDLYITITESKKRFSEDGSAFYEKHKLFLYKEDFDKFLEGLQDTLTEVDNIRDKEVDYNSNGHYQENASQLEEISANTNSDTGKSYKDLSFEDLDS